MRSSLALSLLSLSVICGAACAVPVDSTEALLAPEDEITERVLFAEELGYAAAPESFSFVVEGERPMVVLAELYDEGMAVGDPEWVTAPWMTNDMMLRRDVDVHAVPASLLVRQGEPFVTHPSPTEPCVGYLGELSVVRMINQMNVADLADTTEEEQEQIWSYDRVGPPASERMSDPAVIWAAADNRSYLVAELEDPDGCAAGTFGAHPEHAGVTYSPVPAPTYDAEAHRLFRAHPRYAEQQAEFDAIRIEEPYFAEQWPAGPWDASIFDAQTFVAEDGRQLVLATAFWPYCEMGPGALALLYEVGADGTLTLRAEPEAFHGETLEALIDLDGQILEVSRYSAYGEPMLDGASIAPLELGCSC